MGKTLKQLNKTTRRERKGGLALCSVQTVEIEKAVKVSALHRGFEEVLLEAVDEALSSLGASSKRAVYFHLEKKFSIRRQEGPHKVEEFASALEEIFGAGAGLLEIKIMRRLYEKVGPAFRYFPEGDDLVFTGYTAAAKLLLRP